LDRDGPLLQEDGPGLWDGGELNGPGLLGAESAVGAEQHLDAHGHVVLPEQEHVLAKVLVFFALKEREERLNF
jgi:hypothetical protein